MANYNPKINNLKSNSDRTPIERKQLAQKAGIASGVARNEKRKMKDILEFLLSQDIKQDNELKSTKEAIMLSVVQKALTGDLKAVEFIQNTILEKPSLIIEATNKNVEMDKQDLKSLVKEYIDLLNAQNKPLNADEIIEDLCI